MIYTSYYAMYGRRPQTGMLAVQVSNTIPNWFGVECLDWSRFAPEWKDINGFRQGLLSEEEFKRNYLETLNRKFIKSDVISEVYELLNGHDSVVFLCYEKAGETCHRHWFAEWLGLGVTELKY